MNPLLIAFIPGALIGVAVALLLLGLAPRSVHAGDVLDRIDAGAAQQAAPAAAADTAAATSAKVRIGTWLESHLPDVAGFRAPKAELDLLDIPVHDFFYTKFLYAVTGLLLPFIFTVMVTAIAAATGQLYLLPFAGFPLIFSLIFALVFWIVPDSQVRAKAAARRREFTRFVTTYLELVAVSLLGNTTADSALASAAAVSDSWVFQRIRREYAIADITRGSKWQALERLGENVGVPALTEMARVMRMSEAQVSVRDQLRAACDKLRNQVVTDDGVAAERVSNSMQLPIFLTFAPVLALLLIPTLLQLTTANAGF